ncbi:MAG: hypothetical protein P8Y73_12060 [Desulfuromonadales bacterium]
MKIVSFFILIIFSFLLFGCSNSDTSNETVKKNGEVAEQKTEVEKEKTTEYNNEVKVYDDDILKTTEGLKNYLQGGWLLENKDTTLYYYFDKDSLFHYIIASNEETEKLKENKKFIERSKEFSKARKSKVIYNENGTITSVTSGGNESNASIKIIDDNSFVIDSDEDKPLFKRSNIEKPIVGKVYQKYD